jgi:hypothetical protein
MSVRVRVVSRAKARVSREDARCEAAAVGSDGCGCCPRASRPRVRAGPLSPESGRLAPLSPRRAAALGNGRARRRRTARALRRPFEGRWRRARVAPIATCDRARDAPACRRGPAIGAMRTSSGTPKCLRGCRAARRRAATAHRACSLRVPAKLIKSAEAHPREARGLAHMCDGSAGFAPSAQQHHFETRSCRPHFG